MKHHHSADLKLDVQLPTEDIDHIIDKLTESAIKVILVAGVVHIIRKNV